MTNDKNPKTHRAEGGGFFVPKMQALVTTQALARACCPFPFPFPPPAGPI